MKWRRNLALSVRALARSTLRTLLSAASMAIGISTLVVLLAVGEGARAEFRDALEAMGRNLVAVGSAFRPNDALRAPGSRYDTLTLDDWRAISELPSVARAAPIAMRDFELRAAGEAARFTVIGTTATFAQTNQQILAAGRFLDLDDDLETRRVAVLGSEVVRRLFGGADPVGRTILVGSAPFLVVGTLAEKGLDLTGSTQDERILVPVSTAQRRLLDLDTVDRIFVQAVSDDLVDAAMTDVRRLLRVRHGRPGLSEEDFADDFTVADQNALVEASLESDETLGRFLAATAALTLGMAGFGLLAVSLLSVRERLPEIGLRVTSGARRHHILLQFLGESAMIALLGAGLGVALGVAAVWIATRTSGWRLLVTWPDVAAALGVALALAVLFGAGPAWKAARLDPIHCLRAD